MISTSLYFSISIILVILIQCVDCQICKKLTHVTVTKQVPIHYTYWETYQTRCWFNDNCTKRRRQSKLSFRTTRTMERKYIDECCGGYMEDSDYIDNNTRTDTYTYNNMAQISCRPICMPSCTNGICLRPGECVCKRGYSVNYNNSHECLPVCPSGCEHGTCVAPNTCQCNFGYTSNATICQPICTEPCENGRCTAPDTCECLDGYRKSENDVCEPYCSQGCTNGTCVEPETCICNEGYKKDVDELCVPDCKYDCGKGECVAPDICECDTGYDFQNGICQPQCTEGCDNGFCIEPNVCNCNEGYIKDGNSSSCTPECTFDCGNGTCVKPHVCQCHSGYRLNQFAYLWDKPLCAPICQNCEGSCIGPYQCVCDLALDTRNEREDGGDCDCFVNCTDESRQCYRTVCSNITSTTVDDDPIRIDQFSYDNDENNVDTSETEFKATTYHIRSSSNVRSTSEEVLRVISTSGEERSTTGDELIITEISFGSEYSIPEDNDDISIQDTQNNTKDEDTHNSESQIKNDQWSCPIWIYAVASVTILLIIILTVVLVVKRRSLSNYFKGGSYSCSTNSNM